VPPNGTVRAWQQHARTGTPIKGRLNADRLVFIDETWASKKTRRRPHGRCQRCQRRVAAVSHGHWQITTFVAALRLKGPTAPLVVDGAINGDAFLAFAEQILAPTLVPADIEARGKTALPAAL
jgi:hypothetical protein